MAARSGFRIGCPMSLSVTRCPNCRSTFNISQRQLESSGGQARCGACLRVFLASENLLGPAEGADPADSVFIGRAPEEYFNPDSFISRAKESEEPESAGPNEGRDPAAASGDSVGATHASPVRNDDPGSLWVSEDRDLAGATHASPVSAKRAKDEESIELPELEEQFELLPDVGRIALEQVKPALDLKSGENFNWGAFVGQTTLALMLLVVLAAQYLWRYLPVYSQVDWLRPGYAQICARVDCELPVYSRVNRIRNDSTALRTHPDYPNAYLLATQFHNAAPFPQPFPILVLRFSSLDARTVALREFAPAEYLEPEILALAVMPPASPVQVELEVINPGPRAVNYEVSFRAP